MAHLWDIHPRWHGAEYSRTAVERIRARLGTDARVFEADAQNLPFDDGSFDGVYTWATLEHVADPDKALREIDRVLAIGGFALIAPAWNCRSWIVKQLHRRRYAELSLSEQVEKALIPIREWFWVRAALALPKRLCAEVWVLRGRPMSLRYRRLSPEWDLIETLGHVSDDDAVADIDPHAAACFFKTRHYELLSHGTLLARLLSRHEPVIVRKTKA